MFIFGVVLRSFSELCCVHLRSCVVLIFFSCSRLICRRFINARRRIVQPLIDQSNRAGASGKLVL